MAEVRSAQLFYPIQSEDSLSKIAERHAQFPTSHGERLKELIKLNPQLTNPNALKTGEVIYLGSPGGALFSNPLGKNDLSELSRVWRAASTRVREILQKNFDVLDWLADQKNKVEFLHVLGEGAENALSGIRESRITGVLAAEAILFSRAQRALLATRRNSIYLLMQSRTSVVRMPVFILLQSSNGFYPYAQKLVQMIKIAEEINLGKKLLYFEIINETRKVAQTAINTKDFGKTGHQALKGGTTIVVGYGAGQATKQICQTAFKLSNKKAATIICAVSAGAAIAGSPRLVDFVDRAFFGAPIEKELPPLP